MTSVRKAALSFFRFIGRLSLRALAAGALLVVLAAIVLSPLALKLLDGGLSDAEWTRISAIGQAYGAVSAILSGLALLGVGVSIALQMAETRTSRELNMRMLHFELMRMSLEKKEFLDCWGDFVSTADEERRRQLIYCNLIVSHWEMLFELDDITDARLATISRAFLKGEIGRSFWAASRDLRIGTADSSRAREFHRIVDAEYQQILAGAKVTPREGDSAPPAAVTAKPPSVPATGSGPGAAEKRGA